MALGRAAVWLAAVTILAGAILVSWRFELVGVANTGVYRLDRFTGAVKMCLPKKSNAFELDCSGNIDDWVSVPTK